MRYLKSFALVSDGFRCIDKRLMYNTPGLIMDNGIVKPTPPVTRALLETKAALEKAGHKVIGWTP